MPLEIEPLTVTPAPLPQVTAAPSAAVSGSQTPYDGPKTLVICLPREPETLYRYGRLTRVETAVLHGLYENDFTHLSFAYQPQGLVKLPSFSDGDALWRQVSVKAGDRVVNVDGNVVVLAMGDRVRVAGGETAVFAGTPLVMEQLIAEFTLQPRLWADGQPVTAADSVYAFEVAAHPDTPADKSKVERTATYVALDETRTQWTGLPGFYDATYFTNFWAPLPRHAWSHYTPAELLAAPEVTRSPLGDGPFRLTEWVAGDYLRLEPNPFYYRAAEGLPHLSSVTFRFLPDPDARMAQILTGGCDVVTQDALDVSQADLFVEAEAAGLLKTYFQIGAVYEAIALGVNSWNGYGDGIGRPDWFEDVRVRQALALCLNRAAMASEVGNGRFPVMNAQIPTVHPLFPATLPTWPYDPATANALLDEAGYRDDDGDGRRQDPQTGLPFHVTFTTTTRYESNRLIAQQVQTDLRQCGLDVELAYLPGETWYAAGEESPLFGRRFDLGHIAWPVEAAGESSLCHLFASWQITGPAGKTNPQTDAPYGSWDALNNTGWWLPQYDTACRKTQHLLPGMPGYEENFQETQRLLAENLPMIPLFMRLKLAVAHPYVRHFTLDATQESELWNLYALDISLDE